MSNTLERAAFLQASSFNNTKTEILMGSNAVIQV